MDMNENTQDSSLRLDKPEILLQAPKKKNRGNRALQHFRRRCRTKGFNAQAAQNLMSIREANKTFHQDDQEANDDDDDEGGVYPCLFIDTSNNGINTAASLGIHQVGLD